MNELLLEYPAGRWVLAGLLGGRLDSLSHLTLLAVAFAVGGLLVGLAWGRITRRRSVSAEPEHSSEAESGS
jgi:hypothetical protein